MVVLRQLIELSCKSVIWGHWNACNPTEHTSLYVRYAERVRIVLWISGELSGIDKKRESSDFAVVQVDMEPSLMNF